MAPQSPRRIQMKRSKDWRKPAGAIYVGRPTRWGNPYRIGKDGTAGQCVERFARHCALRQKPEPVAYRDWLLPLRGHDLGCWCRLGEPCHADVLLELANKEDLYCLGSPEHKGHVASKSP